MSRAVSLIAGQRHLILSGDDRPQWRYFGVPLPKAEAVAQGPHRPVPNAALDAPPPIDLCPVEGWGFWGTPGLACLGSPPSTGKKPRSRRPVPRLRFASRPTACAGSRRSRWPKVVA